MASGNELVDINNEI